MLIQTLGNIVNEFIPHSKIQFYGLIDGMLAFHRWQLILFLVCQLILSKSMFSPNSKCDVSKRGMMVGTACCLHTSLMEYNELALGAAKTSQAREPD